MKKLIAIAMMSALICTSTFAAPKKKAKKAAKKSSVSESEGLAFLEMAKKLEEKRKLKAAENKIASHVSKYCPECGRVLGAKKVCKCGYRVKK